LEGSREVSTLAMLPPAEDAPPPPPPAAAATPTAREGMAAESMDPILPSSLPHLPSLLPKNSHPSMSPSRSLIKCSATVCRAGRASPTSPARVRYMMVPTGKALRKVAKARLPASREESPTPTVHCSTAVNRALNRGDTVAPPTAGMGEVGVRGGVKGGEEEEGEVAPPPSTALPRAGLLALPPPAVSSAKA
jgi:hypothetical protein